jgi:hypothetical protein
LDILYREAGEVQLFWSLRKAYSLHCFFDQDKTFNNNAEAYIRIIGDFFMDSIGGKYLQTLTSLLIPQQ